VEPEQIIDTGIHQNEEQLSEQGEPSNTNQNTIVPEASQFKPTESTEQGSSTENLPSEVFKGFNWTFVPTFPKDWEKDYPPKTNDMTSAEILEYLHDNIGEGGTARLDVFYGDGTQDPMKWLTDFEKVARIRGWKTARKLLKFEQYLQEDADIWFDGQDDSEDWATWKDRFCDQYCTQRWKNKWVRELETN